MNGKRLRKEHFNQKFLHPELAKHKVVPIENGLSPAPFSLPSAHPGEPTIEIAELGHLGSQLEIEMSHHHKMARFGYPKRNISGCYPVIWLKEQFYYDNLLTSYR